ncbi:hypothetical protein ACFX13_047286 [Malus domestica]
MAEVDEAEDFGDFKFVTTVDPKKLLLLLLPLPIFSGLFFCSKPNSNTSSCAAITAADLERLEVLSHGNGGTVYKVCHKWTSACFAVLELHYVPTLSEITLFSSVFTDKRNVLSSKVSSISAAPALLPA